MNLRSGELDGFGARSLRRIWPSLASSEYLELGDLSEVMAVYGQGHG